MRQTHVNHDTQIQARSLVIVLQPIIVHEEGRAENIGSELTDEAVRLST